MESRGCVELYDAGTNGPWGAIIRLMGEAYNLDISPYDESFLMKAIDRRMMATGSKTAAVYGEFLAEHFEEAETFYRSLRIVYSEFFRNPLTFALLEQLVLPSLVQEKQNRGRSEIRV